MSFSFNLRKKYYTTFQKQNERVMLMVLCLSFSDTQWLKLDYEHVVTFLLCGFFLNPGVIRNPFSSSCVCRCYVLFHSTDSFFLDSPSCQVKDMATMTSLATDVFNIISSLLQWRCKTTM